MNDLIELPFYHGSCTKPGNGGFPDAFPVNLFFDKDTDMFRLKATDELKELLEEVYLNGSLVDGSISNESGNVYIKPIVDYIIKFAGKGLQSSVLEIGFGKGVILKELKQRGLQTLTGVEPGNHQLLEGMDGIKLINDFFPSKNIVDNVDIICHFAVWEHIEDPIKFIEYQLEKLTDQGVIVFGVPNCESYLEQGDISIFLHEHFNYFTSSSLSIVADKAGGEIIDLVRIYGMLIGVIKKKQQPNSISEFSFSESKFWNKVEDNLLKLKKFVDSFDSPDQIAVYAPGRALNSFFTIGINSIRLVDDNSEISGKYLPFFTSPIESFNNTCSLPPAAILIFSKTFAEKIKEKCSFQDTLRNTKIFCIDDL